MSKYVIFSFDDGRKDQYDLAYKILYKYGFPGTINIVSEFVNDEKKFNCFRTVGNKSLNWENLREMEQEGKWEIACHGANHKNTIEDVKQWMRDSSVCKNHWNREVGFASPESFINKDNSAPFMEMVNNNELLYIRSGKQARREGLLYMGLSYINRYLKNPSIFRLLNKDCVLKNCERVLLSVGITSYDTPKEICSMIDSLEDNESIILMFHSIINDGEAQKTLDRWYWESSRLSELCKYISQKDDIEVITTREWVYKQKNS